MNARTRRDRLLRCATTRDTASARRRKSGMISTSAPLSKYRPTPKSGVEAYLIYWPVVYLIARKGFGFSREWSVPLASGISICGVAAAIATGGAIRARPQVPVLVSSLVVIFAVIEVLLLPALANAFMSHEPLVAAAWMGLAVKTDGAAVAAGASNNPSASSGTRKRPHCRAGRPTLPPPARPGHVRPFESQSAASRRKPGPPNRMKSPR